MYICDGCGKKKIWTEPYMEHMIAHTGEMKSYCKKCSLKK